jgi:hypothetical protein
MCGVHQSVKDQSVTHKRRLSIEWGQTKRKCSLEYADEDSKGVGTKYANMVRPIGSLPIPVSACLPANSNPPCPALYPPPSCFHPCVSRPK